MFYLLNHLLYFFIKLTIFQYFLFTIKHRTQTWKTVFTHACIYLLRHYVVRDVTYFCVVIFKSILENGMFKYNLCEYSKN